MCLKQASLYEVHMKGIHHLKVSNRDAAFEFELYRNITVVRGDSGTGKTTLFDMIADYTRLRDKSGVNVQCDKDCAALTDGDWKNQLSHISDSIVFIDEGVDYLKTKEFADAVKNSDNYYVIFSRESLHELPYSVEEIYEIKASGKYHSLKKLYKSNKKHIYYTGNSKGKLNFDTVLTEDSKSGLQFYRFCFENEKVKCESSNSNAAVFKWLTEHKDRKVFVIADGAAFGSEIDRVLKLQTRLQFRLCLPESFEWLILKSGLIHGEHIAEMLEAPSEFIESSEYFSWENFFEKYLTEHTVGTPFQYAKKELADAYLNKTNSDKIIAEIYNK